MATGLTPATRKEMFLSAAAGETETSALPTPVTREETYLTAASGVYISDLPTPVTREEKYLSAAAKRLEEIAPQRNLLPYWRSYYNDYKTLNNGFVWTFDEDGSIMAYCTQDAYTTSFIACYVNNLKSEVWVTGVPDNVIDGIYFLANDTFIRSSSPVRVKPDNGGRILFRIIINPNTLHEGEALYFEPMISDSVVPPTKYIPTVPSTDDLLFRIYGLSIYLQYREPVPILKDGVKRVTIGFKGSIPSSYTLEEYGFIYYNDTSYSPPVELTLENAAEYSNIKLAKNYYVADVKDNGYGITYRAYIIVSKDGIEETYYKDETYAKYYEEV